MSKQKTAKERAQELTRKTLPQTEEEYLAIGQHSESAFIRSLDEWKSFLNQEGGPHPLSGCDPSTIDAFTRELKFNKGVLVHADYNMLADKITFLQFKELMALFGISMTLFSRWDDYWCPHGTCVQQSGYICFPDGCGS